MPRVKHQPLSEEDVRKLTRAWLRKGDAEAALLAGTFAEDRLGFAIKTNFIKLPARGDTTKTLTDAALFDGYGPLSSFFAKIDIGYALGMYDLRHRNEFHIVRSIRNEFAHAMEATTFSTEEIGKKIDKLQLFGGGLAALHPSIALKDRRKLRKGFYIATCAYLAGYVNGRGEAMLSAIEAPRGS
jgi:hypothetical protein